VLPPRRPSLPLLLPLRLRLPLLLLLLPLLLLPLPLPVWHPLLPPLCCCYCCGSAAAGAARPLLRCSMARRRCARDTAPLRAARSPPAPPPGIDFSQSPESARIER